MALLAGYTSDAAGNPVGIAVTAVDDTNGTWQYSMDGGTTWTAFDTSGSPPSPTSALLLAADANTLVSFTPTAPGWTGSSTITFQAWDGTQGTAGGTGDAAINGGNMPFSVNSATSQIQVVDSGVVGVTTAQAGSPGNTSQNYDLTYPTTSSGFTLYLVPTGYGVQTDDPVEPIQLSAPVTNAEIEADVSAVWGDWVTFADSGTDGSLTLCFDPSQRLGPQRGGRSCGVDNPARGSNPTGRRRPGHIVQFHAH